MISVSELMLLYHTISPLSIQFRKKDKKNNKNDVERQPKSWYNKAKEGDVKSGTSCYDSGTAQNGHERKRDETD
jgi:hypothetical protein